MALAANVPTAQVELDRNRTIAFTIGAMRRVKELTGRSITAGIEEEDVGRVVWAMLTEEDRADLTPEQVEDMIHPGNLGAVTAAIARLSGDAEGAEGNARPAGKGKRKT
ncbi:MAG TPA: hypothetical protein VF167_02940 [Longimicrobiaceae bacterium]